jgi:hypothetical protein
VPVSFRLTRETVEITSWVRQPGRPLTCVTSSQKISSTFSLNSPTTATFGTPASSRRATLGSGVAASDKSV